MGKVCIRDNSYKLNFKQIGLFLFIRNNVMKKILIYSSICTVIIIVFLIGRNAVNDNKLNELSTKIACFEVGYKQALLDVKNNKFISASKSDVQELLNKRVDNFISILESDESIYKFETE